ncbi:MAG TPA: hypothetical protein VG347_17590 [Verrucomicrobiae bacterium]|nr:hypothetical protein [Verrucomicrobiae bacterium]
MSAGFLYDDFDLTLEPGHRSEAAGPFYYTEEKESEATLAFPPFFSAYKNSGVGHGELNVLYPAIAYEYYTDEWRLHFFQLLSFAGGKQPDDYNTRRFTIFPIYFQQRSLDTNLEYTALIPFYGHLQNRLFRDKIYFVMFPLYGQSQKKDIITDNYLYPFVHVRNGDGLHGWQVWPFVGEEHKNVTTQTNGFGDVTTIGGHDKSFVMWPLWLDQDDGIGTENPEKYRASIPLFAVTRSPSRDATSVIWPFFTWVDERGRKYREWEGPWPFVIFARGEGKTTSRVFPLFSQSHNKEQESDWYVWPVYHYKAITSPPLDWHSTRICFYLYVGVTERNAETGVQKLRRDAWPFFTWRRDFNGNTRFQVLAPIEAILADSRGITRNWSPLWSLWRSEQNPRAGRSSQSLLWNLYRRDVEPDHKKTSLLFGLFQYQSDGEKGHLRLFYLPTSKK